MQSVAMALGKKVLRELTKEDVLHNIAVLREKCGDRAILRALHFFHENDRVDMQLQALKNHEIQKFLCAVIESGKSSWMLNQNCYTAEYQLQGIPLALTVSEELLGSDGAYRVHGGGFAGTIQAFVPNRLLQRYLEAMNTIFGENAARPLYIRPFGSVQLPI